MRLISWYLVVLNVLLFPTLVLAESQRFIDNNFDLISQGEEDRETERQGDGENEEVETFHETSEEDGATEEDGEDEIEEKEEESEGDTETEDSEEEAYLPTPEEMARLRKLATADQLYLSGYKAKARKLYREAKETWEIEGQRNKDEEIVELFEDPEQLSVAGKVFWRNYQKGKEQELESKIFSALKLLTTREPEFILGHIHYAQMLQKYERQAEAEKVLDRAVALYPNEPKLTEARIETHVAGEEWLDASILARQFSLFNPDLPESEKLTIKAEEYLAEYQSDLRSKITLNAIGNAIAGTLGFVLTGNLFGPLSALETTSTLIQGEAAIGEASAQQARKQLPLLKDPKVTAYVNEIGQKIASHSGRTDFDYEFFIIMDDSLNAFALPGGKIFINAGAIMKTDSEAELAGLLAHEVSHSALSHGFQLVTQGNLTANVVSYIPYVGNAATSLIVLNYSREMERQADIYGTRILVNSGYAADGVRNLMAKLHHEHSQDEENSEPAEWLSTHPNSKQRIRYMEKLIVDRNLNRFTYEGIARHQEIKHIVREQWQEYKQCAQDVVTLEQARECIPTQINQQDRENEEE